VQRCLQEEDRALIFDQRHFTILEISDPRPQDGSQSQHRLLLCAEYTQPEEMYSQSTEAVEASLPGPSANLVSEI
jgi:hypothetical protein